MRMNMQEMKKYNQLKEKLMYQYSDTMSESPTRPEVVAHLLHHYGHPMTVTGISRKTGIPVFRLKEIMSAVIHSVRFEANTSGTGLSQLYEVTKIAPPKKKATSEDHYTARDMKTNPALLAMSKWNSSLKLN